MDQSTLGLYVRIGETIGQAVADHEERFHVPPPERGPLLAVPFPEYLITDVEAARAVEILETGGSLYEAAEALSAPVPALERKLADFKPRWRRFLHERETAV